MGLEGIVNAVGTVATKVKDHFAPPSQIDQMVEYSIRNYLPKDAKLALQNSTPEQKKVMYQSLRNKIEEQVKYQQDNLDRLSLKVGKGAGIAALINDAYHLYAGTPFSDFGLLQASLVGGKAIMELPAMYRHLTRTGDIYGMMDWIGSKALAWLVPVIGPGLDYNVATRVIRRNAIYRGTKEFLKDLNLEQKALHEKVYDRVKDVAGPVMRTPQYQPAFA